jgi:hypothetical protein
MHFSKTSRWKDGFGRDLKQDPKQIQWQGIKRIHLVQKRVQWQHNVNMVMNNWVPHDARNFLSS